jgi:hypothetical protein
MESPHIVRSLGLDLFASVALQHAATCAPQSQAQDHTPLNPEKLPSFREIQQLNHTSEEARDPDPLAGVSPSVLGLSTVSWFDEYTSDPRFVESQRELRDLLFTSAQSLAPTRAGTPEGHGPTFLNSPLDIADTSTIKSVVSTGERVVWLKNYLDEVAPWVSDYQ